MPTPQYEIVAEHDGSELARYTVAPGEYTVGRASASSIAIKVGPVSRVHARLVVGADGSLEIEDLGSANGTLLNGDLINSRTRWGPADTVQVGDVKLTMREIPIDRAPDDYAPTLSPSQAEGLVPGTSPRPLTAPSSPGMEEHEREVVRKHLPLQSRQAQVLAVEREVARGGMGAILAARESATRRTVAMKVMLRSTDAKEALRFIEEAQVTAQLEHPNIVPVHDLGVDANGQPFYTMKMVEGITLRKVVELLRENVPATAAKYSLPALLTIFQKVCDAMAFAHSRGVLHRDLKPANVMIGKFGEVLVMDWGLAKIIGRPATASLGEEPTVRGARGDEAASYHTLSGAVVGTAFYMSPEQARGEVETLDARSDVFALGVILYEALTLERAFFGKTTAEVIDKVTRADFVPPAKRALANKPDGGRALPHLPGGRVPESLDAIVGKAMAMRREDRYTSVEAMQADLTAYQTGFATMAEHAGAWKQFRLFVARNRRVAATIAVGLATLTLASVGFTARVLQEKSRAEAGEAAAHREAQIAALSAEAAQLVNLAQTNPEDALLRAMLTVEKSRALLGAVTPAVQYGLTAALEAHRLEASLPAAMNPVRQLAWNDHTRRAALAGGSICQVIDLDTGKQFARTSEFGSIEVTQLALSDDGRFVAAGGNTSKLGTWQPSAGREDGTILWEAHPTWCRAIAFLPGRSDVMSVSANGDVKTWSARGEPLAEQWKVKIPGDTLGPCVLNAGARRLVVSPDGPLVTEVFTITLGQPGLAPQVTSLTGHTARVSALALSVDGQFVATGDADGTLRVWSFDGRLVGGPFQAHRGVIEALAFSPDGNTIAMRGMDRQTAVFTHQGVLLHGPFAIETQQIKALAQTGDARLLVGEQGRLKVFNLLGLESAPPIPKQNTLEDIIVTPDGRKLVALDGQGLLHIWDATTHTQLVETPAVDGRGQYVQVSDDGRLLVCTTRTGGDIRFFDLEGRRAAEPLKLEREEMCQSLTFVPGTSRFVAGTSRGDLLFYEPLGSAAPKRMAVGFPADAGNIGVDIIAGRERFMVRALATLPKNSARFLWFDWNAKKLSEHIVQEDFVGGFNASQRVGFVYDADRRILTRNGRRLVHWPVAQGAPTPKDFVQLDTSESLVQVGSLGPDLVGCSVFGGQLRLYTSSGEPVTPWLRRDRFHLDSIVPLPDGRTFVTGGGDRRVRFWHRGLDAWMTAAAERLARSPRILEPQTEIEKGAAALIARLRLIAPPAPVYVHGSAARVGRLTATTQELPAGVSALSDTPLAVPLPDRWRIADAGSVSVLNKLLAALGSAVASRQGEVEFVHALVPEGGQLRDLFLSGTLPGALLVRLDGGITASDLLRLSGERLKLLRGQSASPLFSSFKFDLDNTTASAVMRWNDRIETGFWDFAVTTAAGERVVFRSYLVPTRVAGFVLIVKCVAKDGALDLAAADDLIAKLHVVPEARVEPAFREELRGVIEERAKIAIAQEAVKRRADQFSKDRDAIIRLIDANKPDEAEALVPAVLAVASELEQLDTANPAKWLLESAKVRGEFGWRFVSKGRHVAARTITEPGIAEAEQAVAKLQTPEAKGGLALMLFRAASPLRNLKEWVRAQAAYERGMSVAEEVQAGGLNGSLAERMIEAGNEWVNLLLGQKQTDAARPIYPRILAVHLKLREAATRDNGTLRLYFDDAHLIPELAFNLGQLDEARTQLRAQIELLAAQQDRPGLDASTTGVLARYSGRAQNLIERDPKADLYPRKDLAMLSLAWLNKATTFGPLSTEMEGWRVRADSIANSRVRGRALPRPAAANAQQIDLSRHYTCGLDEQGVATDPKFIFAMLPDGLVKFDGIHWDIRGMVQVSSKSVRPERPAPEKIEGIEVRQRLRKLHVLHATNWSEKEPVEIGSYVLKYADGQTASLPIVYGRDIRDWSVSVDQGQATPNASIAWTGPGGSAGLRLFHRAYENPRPDVEVVSLDFVSANRNAAPFVLAITAE